ncbi:MAG: hypothetical protein K6D95_08260 [Treponema sp.]|nr:hypothetical protein [Treponema sp.]
MKKLHFFALLLLVAMIFSGCKNNVGNASYTGGDKVTTNITITTNEDLQIFKTTKTSRTLLADAFALNDNGLTFYLFGQATSGTVLEPKTVVVTSDNGITGKVTLDIESRNWDLTLAACADDDLSDKNDIISNAVLIGYANVDMQFTNTINFTLSPKGLTKPGYVSLKIAREGDWEVPEGYIGTARIINAIDASAVEGTGDEDLSQILYDGTTTPDPTDNFIPVANIASGAACYTANGAAILPGTYLFEVRFTKEDENRQFVWNDTIIILPGRTSNITLNTAGTDYTEEIVIPNLVGLKPISPTDFKVTYNEDEDTTYIDHYTAEFTWEGAAVKTEKNFAIELAELSDAQDTPADSAAIASNWDTLRAAAVHAYTFDYSAMNDAEIPDPADNTKTIDNPDYLAYYNMKTAGSILANNESITFALELGKRYIARIYSENNAGYSETPVYMAVQDDQAGNKYTVINRYRVTYHPQSNSAVWKFDAQSSGPKVYYWGLSDNDYTVLAPVGVDDGNGNTTGSDANPYLYDGAAKWLYWYTDPQTHEVYPELTGNVYSPEAYTDWQNLDLYAVYSREGNVTLYDDANYDLKPSYVAGFGLTAGNLTRSTTITFSKDGASETSVTVTLPDGVTDEWIYNSVKFTMTYGGFIYSAQEQDGADRGESNEFTINLDNITTGNVYQCCITARYDKTIVSYPFSVYVTD